jgi:hypothetical protein
VQQLYAQGPGQCKQRSSMSQNDRCENTQGPLGSIQKCAQGFLLADSYYSVLGNRQGLRTLVRFS